VLLAGSTTSPRSTTMIPGGSAACGLPLGALNNEEQGDDLGLRQHWGLLKVQLLGITVSPGSGAEPCRKAVTKLLYC